MNVKDLAKKAGSSIINKQKNNFKGSLSLENTFIGGIYQRIKKIFKLIMKIIKQMVPHTFIIVISLLVLLLASVVSTIFNNGENLRSNLKTNELSSGIQTLDKRTNDIKTLISNQFNSPTVNKTGSASKLDDQDIIQNMIGAKAKIDLKTNQQTKGDDMWEPFNKDFLTPTSFTQLPYNLPSAKVYYYQNLQNYNNALQRYIIKQANAKYDHWKTMDKAQAASEQRKEINTMTSDVAGYLTVLLGGGENIDKTVYRHKTDEDYLNHIWPLATTPNIGCLTIDYMGIKNGGALSSKDCQKSFNLIAPNIRTQLVGSVDTVKAQIKATIQEKQEIASSLPHFLDNANFKNALACSGRSGWSSIFGANAGNYDCSSANEKRITNSLKELLVKDIPSLKDSIFETQSSSRAASTSSRYSTFNQVVNLIDDNILHLELSKMMGGIFYDGSANKTSELEAKINNAQSNIKDLISKTQETLTGLNAQLSLLEGKTDNEASKTLQTKNTYIKFYQNAATLINKLRLMSGVDINFGAGYNFGENSTNNEKDYKELRQRENDYASKAGDNVAQTSFEQCFKNQNDNFNEDVWKSRIDINTCSLPHNVFTKSGSIHLYGLTDYNNKDEDTSTLNDYGVVYNSIDEIGRMYFSEIEIKQTTSTKVDNGSVAEQIILALKRAGWSTYAIAIALGNAEIEGRMNPLQTEMSKTPYCGASSIKNLIETMKPVASCGFGLYQWTGSRMVELFKAHGQDSAHTSTQIEWLLKELKERPRMNGIEKATKESYNEWMTKWIRIYEVAGVEAAGKRLSAGLNYLPMIERTTEESVKQRDNAEKITQTVQDGLLQNVKDNNAQTQQAVDQAKASEAKAQALKDQQQRQNNMMNK